MERAVGAAGFSDNLAAGARSYVQAVLLASALAAFATAGEPVALSGRAMGTTWAVKFVPPAVPLDPEHVSRQVAGRLEQLEQMFSTYRPDSELSRFNLNHTSGWIEVSPEVVHVAAESRRLSELTGGAFDVTVAPLVRLWGFGAQRRGATIPAPSEIAAACRLVDWRGIDVQFEAPALRKMHPQITADFSSIAKGFAVDAIGELLRSQGAGRHFAQVGGDVKTSGRGPGGARGWRTGIEEPGGNPKAIACVVELESQALSTSGDYRNSVIINGRRYGHIIDPRTGRPVSSALASVSVVHASSAWSSALATALFVLGPDDGFRLAQREGLACLFVIRGNGGFTQRMTPEFDKLQR